MILNLGLTSLLAQADAAEEGASWLDTIQNSGPVGYIILLLSVVALVLIFMHFVQIRRAAIMPRRHLDAVDQMLASNDNAGALKYCLDPGNDCYLTRILSAGLTRFEKSAFGAFEIKSAIEETGEDQTSKLYRSTDALEVIGAIAPLLGLLGTVIGMVGAFESISRSAGSQHEELARSISMALVTTLMGLSLAIPCVAMLRFFRNRIDAIASEAASEIERLTLHLESTGGGTGASARQPSPPTAPRPATASGARK